MPTFRQRQRGVTLIESAVSLCITAALACTVAPAFQRAAARHAVEALSAQIETELQHARGLAVAQAQSVHWRVDSPANVGCYVVYTGPAAACSCSAEALPVCEPEGRVLQSAHVQNRQGVKVRTAVHRLTFAGDWGTVTPTATFHVEHPTATQRVIVNVMGRVRSCSPDKSIPGQPGC